MSTIRGNVDDEGEDLRGTAIRALGLVERAALEAHEILLDGIMDPDVQEECLRTLRDARLEIRNLVEMVHHPTASKSQGGR